MTSDEKIDAIHKDITEIKTVLLGVPDSDDRGICGDVKNLYKRLRTIEIALASLGGAGLLGTGIYEVIKRITS